MAISGANAADNIIQYFPAPSLQSTGRTVVILPGGGYAMVALEHEGTAWAPFFNSLGVNVAVVNYRLPEGNRETPIADALGTIDYLKKNAESLGVNPEDIGIMGSSAGGHLASVIATQAPDSLRPSFQVLFYPVISMMPELTHLGSHNNLLGVNPTAELERYFSSELQVDRQTPRAIMLLSADDKGVNPENSISYFRALNGAGIPAALHIYPTGGHGWGINDFAWHDAVLDELAAWIKSF